ncbi:MAG: hypothetical protein ACFFDI_15875 [Promethearchaeota archaeon]
MRRQRHGPWGDQDSIGSSWSGRPSHIRQRGPTSENVHTTATGSCSGTLRRVTAVSAAEGSA